jgi:riboflavin synthase
MFTGLIEAIGTVRQALARGGQMSLEVDCGPMISQDIQIGDSIAVNGVCLTVSARQGTCARFDISGESLSKTTLKYLKPGRKVNLERAMSAQGRFGGHFVQGHIDGTGQITAIRKQGDYAAFRFSAPPELLGQMVLKGSVAVDGVSLTIAALDKTGFEVALIPTTLRDTIWHLAVVGDPVNIETDVLLKMVRRQIEQLLPEGGTLTLDTLKSLGF